MKKTTKPATKVVEVQKAKPTSRTVEKLIDELINHGPSWDEKPSYKLRKKIDAEMEKYQATARIKKMMAERDRLEEKENEQRERRRARGVKLRQLYYVDGTSPKVLAELRKFVEDVHSGKI